MDGIGRLIHAVAFAAVAAALSLLASCADVRLTQDPDVALVGLGAERRPVPARDIAPLYATYAVLAAKAYETPDRPGSVPVHFGTEDALAEALLRDWHYAYGQTSPLPCRDGGSSCAQVPGLGFQAWFRTDARCSQMVLSFRGTDSSSLGDWLSNFHAVTRVLPLFDQYEQVQANISAVIDMIQRDHAPPRCRGRSPDIIAIGHSLGGGLAQQAAYVDRRIRKVVTFDPSFVTGYYDQHVHALAVENSKGLRIARVYEHGEILAYARFVLRQIYPVSTHDPQIDTVRFNVVEGNVVTQHSMRCFAMGLLYFSGPPGRPPDKARPPATDWTGRCGQDAGT